MSSLCIFFAGAFCGACVTFLSMCFALCISQTEGQDTQTEDKGAADE